MTHDRKKRKEKKGNLCNVILRSTILLNNKIALRMEFMCSCSFVLILRKILKLFRLYLILSNLLTFRRAT